MYEKLTKNRNLEKLIFACGSEKEGEKADESKLVRLSRSYTNNK